MEKLTLATFLVGALARAAHADATLDEAKQHLAAATQRDTSSFGYRYRVGNFAILIALMVAAGQLFNLS